MVITRRVSQRGCGLSDAADPVSRTYEARYVLEGAAARRAFGRNRDDPIPDDNLAKIVAVPLGAIADKGATSRGLAYRPEHVDRHVPSCEACRARSGGGAD